MPRIPLRLSVVLTTGVVALTAHPLCLCGDAPPRPAASFRIHPPEKSSAVTKRTAEILAARIQDSSGARAVESGPVDLHIRLALEPGIGREGFRIADGQDGGIQITGNDERGLFYGTGKFLHASAFGERAFTPASWRGTSVPAKPVRGMYLATHFHNFYHEAPIEEVTRYVEDCSLWGLNSFLVWFGMEEYTGIDDPKAQAQLVRLRALLKIVRDLGLDASLGCICNDGYKNSPANLRADDSTVGHAGYHTKMGPRIYNLGNELCPSKPGVPEMELGYCREKFDAFKSIGLDYWFIAPYDNGGCTCPKCAPWGTNGYLRMAEMIAKDYRRAFPGGKVVMSTWYFDRWADGEWAGITERFNRQKPDWVDYIMADDYGGKYPAYPLEHGSPGGLPLLNFPEISMYLHYPWGGFGSNPLPKYLQTLWDVTKGKLSGGFPYSEGIYEDVNKAICAQLYWDPDKPASQTVREYIAFHFSPAVVYGVGRAMEILERNLERAREDKDGITRFVMKNREGAEEAYRLVAEADGALPARARESWRWRVVYLRALVDSELASHEFRVTEKCVAAFRELTTRYHAERSWDMIAPPKNLSGVIGAGK
jgi:hypothetical protein